jgi:hypothetical protein
MDQESKDKLAPAYIPWRTFINFINTLRDLGLPSQINRSLMNNHSYSTQAQLLAAMRSLGLINTEGTPEPILARFVESGEDKQAEIIGEILKDRYAFVFMTLDLSRATMEELEKRFKEAGLTGGTVGRAVAFFLGAADAASIQLSPHIKKSTPSSAPRRGNGRAKRRPRSENVKAQENASPLPSPATPSTLTEKLMDKFPEFDPSWPDDIKKQWFAGFGELMSRTKDQE